jgi:hypothetical protein
MRWGRAVSCSEPSPAFQASGSSSPMPGFHESSSSSPELVAPSSSPAPQSPPSFPAPWFAFPPHTSPLDLDLDFGVSFAPADVHHADDAVSSTPLSGPTSTPGLTTASSPLSSLVFTSPFLPTSTTARSPVTRSHLCNPQADISVRR